MSLGTARLSGRQPGERQKLESSVKLLLIWVAASDGTLDDAELAFIDEQLPDTERTVKSKDLATIVQARDLKSIESALRTIAKESRDVRLSFLDMAITMAVADREVAIPEGLILRFYADALFLGDRMLRQRFRSIAGKDLPDPEFPA